MTTAWGRFWRDWLDGLRLIRRQQVVWLLVLVMCIAAFGDAILSALLVVFVQDEMKVGALEFGWMLTARGIGGILGGIVIAHIGKVLQMSHLVTLGLILSGVLLLMLVNLPILFLVLILLVLVGITAMGWLIGAQTILQLSVTDEYRGRVFGALGATLALPTMLGAIVAGGLADQLGTVPLLDGAAGIYIIAGLLSLALLSRKGIPSTADEGASSG